MWNMRVGWGGGDGGQPETKCLTRLLSKSDPRWEEEEFGALRLSGNRWKEGSLRRRGGLLKMEPCEERCGANINELIKYLK